MADSGESYKGRDDEAFILRFLRAKKFDIDKAFKMVSFRIKFQWLQEYNCDVQYNFQMLKYHSMKKNSPELFHVSPPAELKPMLEMQIQWMLPQKDSHLRQVYIFRVGM